MGFTGDYVIARSKRPLLDLLTLTDGGAVCDEGDGIDCFQLCSSREGFWQTLQIHHGLEKDREWLQMLVDETDSPVMIASVHDSDLCEVRGLNPRGGVWSATLNPQAAVHYEIPADANPTSAEVESMIDWYRNRIPAAIYAITQWSIAAELAVDEDRVADILTKRADPFVEDLFFELLEAAGLPAVLPETPGDDGADESLVHARHKVAEHWLGAGKLERAVLNMKRDSHVVVECLVDVNCYAQAWLRPDGTYQLEYRDLSPSEHYQARTISSEKVINALTGWAAGEITWRDQFQWMPLGGPNAWPR
jgi:hypothetical protein